MSELLRIGLVGLDTSHVTSFTAALNDQGNASPVAGGRVVVAFPGGSSDIKASHSRVAGYTEELRDKHGVRIVDSPAAVAEAADLVFIESIDGRVHLPQLKEVLPFKRPVFVDKPMATSTADAREMFRLADAAGVPLMSASSLRYAVNLVDLIADTTNGEIVGCDVFGPMAIIDEPPGYFWYGIHSAEILFAVLGVGCTSVQVTKLADFDLIQGVWADGRLGVIRGSRRGHGQFGVTIHRPKGFGHANLSRNAKPAYNSLLEAILRSLPHGRADIPADETLAVIRFLEAAGESRETGKPVSI